MRVYNFDITFGGHICIITDDADEVKQRLEIEIEDLIKRADEYLKDTNNYSLTISDID